MEKAIPAVHYSDSLGAKCSVRLDKAEWINNLEDEQPLDDKFYIEDLYKFLKTKPKDKDYGNAKSFWEYAKRIWNINNPEKSKSKKMPDYRKLVSLDCMQMQKE